VGHSLDAGQPRLVRNSLDMTSRATKAGRLKKQNMYRIHA
jgi:hypothetical protein